MGVISRIIEEQSYEPADAYTFNVIEGTIRRCCPGSYILKMSKITNGIRVEFIFNDPEDATFFLLKWM